MRLAVTTARRLAHPGFRHPDLGRRTAPGGLQNADRHPQRVAEMAGKEVGHCAVPAHHVGRTCLPLSAAIILQGTTAPLGHLEEAYRRTVGRRNLALGVGQPVVRSPLHVGLPAAQPHLAEHDVAQHNTVAPAKHFQRVRSAGLCRRYRHPPAAYTVHPGRQRVARSPARHDADRIARIGPPPQGNGRPLLQHHVVGKHRRQRHGGVTLRPAAPGKDRQEERQNSNYFLFHFFLIKVKQVTTLSRLGLSPQR